MFSHFRDIRLKRNLEMSGVPEQKQETKDEKAPDESKANDNSIDTCGGGLTEDQLKDLQAELDQAKEDNNNFSSSSRCIIT